MRVDKPTNPRKGPTLALMLVVVATLSRAAVEGDVVKVRSQPADVVLEHLGGEDGGACSGAHGRWMAHTDMRTCGRADMLSVRVVADGRGVSCCGLPQSPGCSEPPTKIIDAHA